MWEENIQKLGSCCSPVLGHSLLLTWCNANWDPSPVLTAHVCVTALPTSAMNPSRKL